jgi:hypothetical protein
MVQCRITLAQTAGPLVQRPVAGLRLHLTDIDQIAGTHKGVAERAQEKQKAGEELTPRESKALRKYVYSGAMERKNVKREGKGQTIILDSSQWVVINDMADNVREINHFVEDARTFIADNTQMIKDAFSGFLVLQAQNNMYLEGIARFLGVNVQEIYQMVKPLTDIDFERDAREVGQLGVDASIRDSIGRTPEEKRGRLGIDPEAHHDEQLKELTRQTLVTVDRSLSEIVDDFQHSSKTQSDILEDVSRTQSDMFQELKEAIRDNTETVEEAYSIRKQRQLQRQLRKGNQGGFFNPMMMLTTAIMGLTSALGSVGMLASAAAATAVVAAAAWKPVKKIGGKVLRNPIARKTAQIGSRVLRNPLIMAGAGLAAATPKLIEMHKEDGKWAIPNSIVDHQLKRTKEPLPEFNPDAPIPRLIDYGMRGADQVKDYLKEYYSAKIRRDLEQTKTAFGWEHGTFNTLRKASRFMADARNQWLKDKFAPNTEALTQPFRAIGWGISSVREKLAERRHNREIEKQDELINSVTDLTRAMDRFRTGYVTKPKSMEDTTRRESIDDASTYFMINLQ